MDKIQFKKPSVDEIPVINFVRTRAADIAEAERILDQIRDAENALIKTRVAPLKASEAIDKLEVEAAEVAAEIDSWLQYAIFCVCRRLPIPYVRMDGQAGKIILALSMDRIRKAGEAVVDADDAMAKSDREKKVVELTKSIDKHRTRISKIFNGQDQGAVFEVVRRWRSTQRMIESPVDPFGSSLDDSNPFRDAYSSLDIGRSVAKPDRSRYQANVFSKVSYFYQAFL